METAPFYFFIFPQNTLMTQMIEDNFMYAK